MTAVNCRDSKWRNAHPIFVTALTLVLLFGVAQTSSAQSAAQSISYVAEAGVVYAFASTSMSYGDALYYDDCLSASLTQNGSTVASTPSVCNVSTVSVSWNVGAVLGATYNLSSDHWVYAYYRVYEWVNEVVGYQWVYYDASYYYYYWYYVWVDTSYWVWVDTSYWVWVDYGDGDGYWDLVPDGYWAIVSDGYWDTVWDGYWVWTGYWQQDPIYQWVYVDTGTTTSNYIWIASLTTSYRVPSVSVTGISPSGALRGSSGALVLSGRFAGVPSLSSVGFVGSFSVTSANNSQVNATYSISPSSPNGFGLIAVGIGPDVTYPQFTVSDPSPVITSIAPASATVGSSVNVVIAGSYFRNGPSLPTVQVSPAVPVTLAAASDSQITATLDLTSAAPGSYVVTVNAVGMYGAGTPQSASVGFTAVGSEPRSQPQTGTLTNDPPPEVAPVPTPPPAVVRSVQMCNDISGNWTTNYGSTFSLSENAGSVTGIGTTSVAPQCGTIRWQITGTDRGGGSFTLSSSNPQPATDLCGNRGVPGTANVQINSCTSATQATSSAYPLTDPNAVDAFAATAQQLTWGRSTAAPAVAVGVDLMAGRITTQLSGYLKTSNLRVTVNNDQGQELLSLPHNSAASGSSFSDPFRTQLPAGQAFGSVTAIWDNISVTAPVRFFTIGLTRFTQYNTPYHSQCSGNTEPVLIINQISGGSCFYQDENFSPAFINAVNLNGTGVFDVNGVNTVVKAYAAGARNVCGLYSGPGAVDQGHTFFSVDVGGNAITTVTGSGNRVLSDGTNTVSAVNRNNPPPGSLATDSDNTDRGAASVYLYSDPVLLFDQNDNNDARGLRSVQDRCPGCAGQATQSGQTPAHIDMYNSVSNSCSARAVGDYGQYYAIRVR